MWKQMCSSPWTMTNAEPNGKISIGFNYTKPANVVCGRQGSLVCGRTNLFAPILLHRIFTQISKRGNRPHLLPLMGSYHAKSSTFISPSSESMLFDFCRGERIIPSHGRPEIMCQY